MLGLSGDEYRTVAAWVGEPMHAILMILFLATLLFHSNLGVQMVVEDYIHHGPTRIISLVIVKFLHAALAVAGIYAVCSLSFGGQA